MQPEIYNDELYYTIIELVKIKKPKTILEIGSATGEGSTTAFIKGALQIRPVPEIYCLETVRDRYNELVENTREHKFVHCYNWSSIPLDDYINESGVEFLLKTVPKLKTNQYPVKEVLKWLAGDRAEIEKSQCSCNGIGKIKKASGVRFFDMVLIDGSPFTGFVELTRVLGAKIIILDDIIDIKNWDSYQFMTNNPHYTEIRKNEDLRNGYAVYEWRA